MGLLDSLFNDATYGGQGGGLLDFLRQSQMQQEQYQPSAGFPQAPASFADRFNAMPGAPQPVAPSGRSFDSAQFNPQTFAPNQAQPIAVGSNYQMPRLGNADQFNPQQALIPPNAQPAQGQLPMQQPAQPQQQTLPQFLQPQGAGFGDRLNASAQNFANAGGLLPALVGGISGLVTGQRTDAQGVAQQDRRAQFESLRQSLLQNGESMQSANTKAMLAVMNPEAAKTVIPELLSNKADWGVVSEDPLEGKKYGWINKRDQTINGKEMGAAAPSSGSMGALQAAQNAGVTGPALYEHLPVAMRNTVKAMIEGRQPLPSTTAMRSPATLALIDAAHAIDPTFDATAWKARNEAGPDWSKGKSSEMVRAANQTLGHVDSLMKSMDALNNRAMPLWNAVANTVSENFGTGEQTSFRLNAHAVAEEMSKVFKGANLSDSEIRSWEHNLSENMSPTQQRAAIAKLSELLHGSLEALEKKRADALGPMAAAKAPPIIGEEGRKVLERVDKWVSGDTSATKPGPSNKPATVRQNGHTYTLQPDGSYK